MENMENNFEKIYEKYNKRVYKYVAGRIQNKSDIEDIVQEVFVKVYKNMNLYDENKGNFCNFILANANQVLVEYYRKRVSENTRYERIVEENEKKVYEYFEKIDGEYGLEKFLCKLPKMQRKAIELVYIEGLSYKDVAKILRKTELSVKSLIFRAKNSLKKLIENDEPDIVEEYFGKKIIKIIILSVISITMVTGLTYAIVKIYESIIKEKDTYTLSEMKQEIPIEESDISEEEAKKFIENYLSVIERKNVVLGNDIKLIKDYEVNQLCWIYDSEDYTISVDALTGKFISFHAFNENDNLKDRKYFEILEDLNVDEYELYKDELLYDVNSVVLCKKYGELFNKYESVSIIYKDNSLQSINIVDFKYEDKEVLIDKAKAIEICIINSEEVKEIDLCIENVFENRENSLDNYTEQVWENDELYLEEWQKERYDIRKVWKIETESLKTLYIDSYTGEVFDVTAKNEYLTEERSS